MTDHEGVDVKTIAYLPTGTEARFFSKVHKDPETGCWLWAAGLNRDGYGQFAPAGFTMLAHRWAYTHFVGPIPDGLTIDHLCRVRNCVNPKHMEPVTQRENTLRGETYRAGMVSRTECPAGHPYNAENTHWYKSRRRVCRICERVRDAARYARARGLVA